MSNRLTHAGCALVVAMLIASFGARAVAAEVTEKRAVELAREIEEAMSRGDGTVLDEAIDMNAIGDKATAGIKAPPGAAAAFKTGLAQGKFGQQIADQVQQGGMYSFLRLRGTPQDRRLLFRMSGEEGLNYHEMHLAADADGQPRIVDIYIMMSGEPITQTFRRLFLPLAAEANKGRLARLVQGEEDFIKHLDDVNRLNEATRSGQAEEALKIYDSLPESLRKEKMFMLQRMMAAYKVDQALYQQAIADYEKQFPNDPSGLIVRLDGLFLSGQYDKLLETIDALDKTVGGDPYLDLYRGNAYFSKGDKDTAKKHFNKLIKAEPEIPDPYYTLIDMAVAEKDFEEVARLLGLAEKNTAVRFDHLADVPDFAEFLKSDAHKKWARARAEGAAPEPAESQDAPPAE